jgi:amino acid adenylation domain-containing protein
MSNVAAKLKDLSAAQKRELLTRLMRMRAKVNRKAPASYAQQRLWFLEQLVAGNPFYNESSALRLKFPVDRRALQATLNDLGRRHESLRTVFEAQNGEPQQSILAELELPVVFHDLSSCPGERREAEALAIARKSALQPFDLSTGPLLRVTLIQLAPSDFLFVLNMHHIVCDGWSMKVFFSEFQSLYEAHLFGRPASLPPLSIQYADFAIWQREYLSGARLAAELEYWEEKLAGISALELPLDYLRPSVPSFRGARETLRMPASTVAAIRAICEQESATLFMGLLAVYQTLLCRYSGQSDSVVGCPVANRNRPELEQLIGFFVNTLVMRTDLSGDPTFRELVRRVRETALSAYAHADVPFEKLVEELQPRRDPSRNPLFQVTFQLLNAPASQQDMASDLLQVLEFDLYTAKFDLRCDMWETGTDVLGQLEYSTDLFAPETGRALARQFETLAEEIAHAPDSRISKLRILAPEDERRILRELNATTVHYPDNQPVHERVAQHVQRFGNCLAVRDTNIELKYEQLNTRANRLAGFLRKRGVMPGSLVAILMDRSAELVVSALAVLKASAAYVPMDPAYPEERLAAMIRDAAVPFALTQQRHAHKLPPQLSRLCVDTDSALCSEEQDIDPGAVTAGTSLAYVIFTSGSTGRPRGVEVTHDALNNLISWHIAEYKVTPDDRATLYASPAFDASVWEIWPYLCAGASLHIPDAGTCLSAVALADWMADRGITLSFLPTPVAESFVEGDLPAGLRLRALLTGGDKLRAYPTRRLPFRLVNHYGPTENTVVATFADVSEGPAAAVPPIGRPIANVQAYVLDRNLRPVPVGQKGELYLGGRGLARGYLNQPAATNERFIVNPFDRTHASRLYQTGDVVRYRHDGNLEFHGRADRQVKIRGFRIEPGDIEAVLDRHPAVQRSLVATRVNGAGEESLVAYVVRRSTPESQTNTVGVTDDYIAEWQNIYEAIYSSGAPGGDGFNIVGWNSSYDGTPLSEAEMREQVDGTVERIRSLGGWRVLEIGCGTGLLLLRLAGECERYVGTDFSAGVLAELERECRARGLGSVELWHRTADEFREMEAGSFDVVVLNSVVQYFPGMEYLVRVLEGAMRALRPGGRLFVGDVRSLPLLSLLHGGIELGRVGEQATAGELRQRVERRVEQEQELVIDPQFFPDWAATGPLRPLWMELKRGWRHNELTRFRYDVALQVGGAVEPEVGWQERRWEEWGSAEGLRRYLREERPAAVVIRGVPNARLAGEARLVEHLQRGEAGSGVAQLRRAVAQAAGGGVEPEQLWQLGSECGYGVRVGWSAEKERCDVWCVAAASPGEPGMELRARTARPWSAYANAVLAQRREQQLSGQLRQYLRERLPEYMAPTAWVWMEALPLTPNGKLDRRALPAPEADRGPAESSYVAPRAALEEQIAGIWSQILGLERISVHANFFDLGGHSLLLVRMHSALKQTVPTSLSLIDLFHYPTVSALAAAIAAEERQPQSQTMLRSAFAGLSVSASRTSGEIA